MSCKNLRVNLSETTCVLLCCAQQRAEYCNVVFYLLSGLTIYGLVQLLYLLLNTTPTVSDVKGPAIMHCSFINVVDLINVWQRPVHYKDT